jgi:ATP-dependent helicase/nuclease subunit B
VSNLIDLDTHEIKAGHTIKILQIEATFKTEIQIPELKFPVFLGGKIDRIDQYNDQLRIIDYKTGNVKQGEMELVDWNMITDDSKYSKVFQVLAYALMTHKEFSVDPLEAGIISFKNLNNGFLKFAKREKPRGGTKETTIAEEILNEFSLQLKQLILEICDPNQPFTEKEIIK